MNGDQPTTRNFTNTVKAAEAAREVALRKVVYPRFVERGSMTQGEADRRLQIMEEIAGDYRLLARKQEQLDL